MILTDKNLLVRSDYFLILVAFTIALLDHLFAERILLNQGLGWDGLNYGTWAQNFYEQIVVHGVNNYWIQRILPSALVHYSLRLLAIPLTIPNIIEAFSFINVILITLMAWVWCLIVAQLNISNRGKWLGFIGLFLNHAILKHTFYYPVLTDIYAYAIGLVMIYFFLTNRLFSLCILTIAGSFVWPTALVSGSILLLFPRENNANIHSTPARFKLNYSIGYASAIVFLVLVLVLYFKNLRPFSDVAPLFKILFIPNILIVMMYLFFGIKILLDDDKIFDWHCWIGKVTLFRQLLVLVLILIVTVFIYNFSTTKGSSLKGFLVYLTSSAIKRPGMFFISHIIYYGPLLIVALFLWPQICKGVQSYGIGLILSFTLALVLSLASVSRQFILQYAIILPFIIKATDSLEWKKGYYWLLAGMAIILSKIWLPINLRPFDGKYSEFPWQLYFMSHGSYMSNEMYLVQGLAVLVSAGIIYRVMFYKTPMASG
ncbi:MAG: hypothetical protein U1F76_18890 [Candidatus Competibacteraceae bacterium]